MSDELYGYLSFDLFIITFQGAFAKIMKIDYYFPQRLPSVPTHVKTGLPLDGLS